MIHVKTALLMACTVAVISAFPEKVMNTDEDGLNGTSIAKFADDVQATKRARACPSLRMFWLNMPCYTNPAPKIKITPELIESMKSFFRNRYPKIQFTPKLLARLTSTLRQYLKQIGRLAD